MTGTPDAGVSGRNSNGDRLVQQSPGRRRFPGGQTARAVATAATVVLSLAACGGPPGPKIEKEAAAQLPRGTVDLPDGTALSFLVSTQPSPGVAPASAALIRDVIYVHGTPGAASGWADYVDEPIPGTRSIAIDRPGFGESGPEGAVTALEAQARALGPWIDDAIRKPVIVGHSLGGPIAAQAAVTFKGKIGALVILAGSLDPGLEDLHWVQPIADWPILSWLLPRPIRNANRELIALEQELETLADALSEIDVPIVIVHGTLDTLVPYDNVAFMRAKFVNVPTLEVVTIPDQNHFLPWNAIETVRQAVARAIELAEARERTLPPRGDTRS